MDFEFQAKELRWNPLDNKKTVQVGALWSEVCFMGRPGDPLPPLLFITPDEKHVVTFLH